MFYQLSNKHLWEKRKKKAKTEEAAPRIAHPKLPSIENRPAQIRQRSERGHWEMDLIIGKAETSHVLLTLTERYSRQELIFKLPNRKAATIRGVFDRLERQHKDFSQRFKSLTTDNGSEFMEYEKLCRSIHGGSRFQVWYCHSYAAWEKGSVENHNRMIRRFFPKGTDFSKISKKRIAAVQNWMNNYPRKSCNGRRRTKQRHKSAFRERLGGKLMPVAGIKELVIRPAPKELDTTGEEVDVIEHLRFLMGEIVNAYLTSNGLDVGEIADQREAFYLIVTDSQFPYLDVNIGGLGEESDIRLIVTMILKK